MKKVQEFKRIKRLLFLLAAISYLFPVTFLYAQTDLPTIIKPSPETSALFRFQDYPMDYSTGLPQISIPIYEINSGSLSVPVSISYHASGRKVYDRDGPVGVGWSLNTGGSISRVIHGSVDFGTISTGTYAFPYPFKLDNLNNVDDITYLQKIIHLNDAGCGSLPWTDSEYDIFSYSIGNNSGKFFFKDVNAVKTPVFIPYKPFNMTISYTSTGLNSIDIIDDKGVLYQFSPGETYSQNSQFATSAWRLTRIISADKTDTISFSYTNGIEERTSINRTATLKDAWNMQSEPYPLDYLSYGESTTEEEYSVSRISEITFKQGKVKFNLAAGNIRIDNIQILNLNNEVLKTIQFNTSVGYSQSVLGYATYKLDKISFKDKFENTAKEYSFEYYPLVSSNGQINARHRDWWGYYNNSGVNETVPKYTNLPYEGTGGTGTINLGSLSNNREPSLEPLKSCVLKKIKYPTGGTTEFIYELNKCKLYGSLGSTIDGPGLRLYQVKSTSGSGPEMIKTYKYGTGESGYGSIDLIPDITNMATETKVGFMAGPYPWDPQRAGSYRQRIFYSGFIPELSELAERPVIYTEVAEYDGTTTSNVGKIIYKYDNNTWAASGMPALTSLTIPRKHIYNYNYWNNPSLIAKEEYKWVSGTTYQLVKTTTYNYTSTVTENVKGLHVQRVCSVPQTGYGYAIRPGETTPSQVCSEQFALYSNTNNPLGLAAPLYTFNDYQIPVGNKNMMSSTETIYNSGGTSITNVITNEYNNKQLISKITYTSSKGLSMVVETKYPFEYTSNSVLTQMATLNMLNYPVEQFEFVNSAHKKSTRTAYFNWGTTPARIAPKTVEVKNGTGSYETRLRYTAYDQEGHVQTVSNENDILHSYVWDYKNVYPIAQVINAAATDIAYTSFEADGKGNWAFTGTSAVNSTAPSGKKAYTLGASITKNGLSTATTYIVSYWKRSGAVAVNGTTPITGKTINGWTYYEHKVVNPSGGLITVSGTNGVIDELRLYPATARMTTFTYEPLIGMTSQCDAGNRITYYEYDNIGRLTLIKDQDKNILKRICYNYAGQPESCPPFANVSISGNFKRNNCTGCQAGSSVTYVVPAGTYTSSVSQAAADQLAQDDVDTNGQTYANAHGTCGPPPNAGANSVNMTSDNITLIFTNTCTYANYYYYLNPNSSASFGPFPSGTYTVYLSSSGPHTFIVNGYSQSGSSSVNFYNVVINGGASVQVTN